MNKWACTVIATLVSTTGASASEVWDCSYTLNATNPRQVRDRFQVNGSELELKGGVKFRILSNNDTALMAAYSNSHMSNATTPASPITSVTLIAIDEQSGGFLREAIFSGRNLPTREGRGACKGDEVGRNESACRRTCDSVVSITCDGAAATYSA
jgi:hypothetical protein